MVYSGLRFNSVTKRVTAVIIAVLIVISALAGIDVGAASGGFYVSGTSIYDANGNPFVMRGVNVPHAWYTSQTETSLKAIAATGANTVRVVVSNGAQWSKTSYSELKSIIDMCKQNKLVCVLEVHDATGSDSASDLYKAADYWVEMKDILIGNEAYVILNIANEWYGSWDGSAWADGNKNAIKSVRNAGIKNMIMIDSAGWGQYPDSIKDFGKSVFNADSLGNTVFSIHMYEYAGGNASTVRTNIDNALGIGVPVVIGEFAAEHTGGDVDEATIMSYCTSKNVGYLGWSWKGNNSDLASLDVANSWDGSSLTSWGNTLINGANGIKATSKICSVYSGGTSGNTGNDNNGSTGGSNSGSTGSSSSDNYTSLFYGSAKASGWNQAVSVATSKNGGSFNGSSVKSGGHFYVEYKGTKDKLEFILQSWSGAESWAKVSISESGTANGNYYAKFSYDNCVLAAGTKDFANKLDMIHVGAAGSSVEVISVCYDYGTGSTSNNNSSNNNNSNNNSDNNTSADNNTSTDTDNGSDSGSDAYTSLFWGENSASNWAQAVSVSTAKNGGSFNGSEIKSNGYFYVEYDGSKDKIELILQSWSGAESWAKVSISESGTANGNYYAKFSYNNCVSAAGTKDFVNKLDTIHVGAMDSNITVYSVCYCYN
ncbi:MAG: cellulase family glycosylhydrolase [Oscillospiraceae bacterium]|nr:cellulase family glycosylhydrolase [Oscillospiraceae bacterium]